MNRSALEQRDLGASFEPYSNLVSDVIVSLSLTMYSLLFYNGVCYDQLISSKYLQSKVSIRIFSTVDVISDS